jgi:hypothetical protein
MFKYLLNCMRQGFRLFTFENIKFNKLEKQDTQHILVTCTRVYTFETFACLINARCLCGKERNFLFNHFPHFLMTLYSLTYVTLK